MTISMEDKFLKASSSFSQAPCLACHGKGEVWEDDQVKKSQILVPCSFCGGTGRDGDSVKKVLTTENFDLRK